MSKIRTLADLQDILDTEMSWRTKEIAYLKSNARSAKSYAQITYIRAGVPLLYAHWEGFVKKASESYLGYVASQRLRYSELASCFVVFGAKKHLANLVQSRRSTVNTEAVEFLRKSGATQADLALANAVDTESNLSSIVFENIAVSVGVSSNPYESWSNFIDKSLLARRNKIAHGEYLDLHLDAFADICDQLLRLLRMYKTDIENAASTEAYKIAA